MRLGFKHGRRHLFRAALEGVAVEVAEVFRALATTGLPVRDIRVVGGGAERSRPLSCAAACASLGNGVVVVSQNRVKRATVSAVKPTSRYRLCT